MDVNQNTFELIDRFLDNELNHLETESFLEQLKNDASLREEVKIQSELRKAINVNSIGPLKKRLDNIRDKVRSEEHIDIAKKEAKIRPLFWRLSIAAGVLLLIGFFSQRYLFQEVVPDGYNMVASKEMSPTYVSETRSFSTNEKTIIKIRLLQSNTSTKEQPSYTFQNDQLDIFISNSSSFNKQNLTIILYEDESEKQSFYLINGEQLYGLVKTVNEVNLLKETNQEIINKFIK